MIRYAIFFLLASTFSLSAQEKYWIYFKDKGSQQSLRSLSRAPMAAQQSAVRLGISPRSLERRALRATQPGLTDEDLPVAPEYLDALRAQGVAPLVESRWLNAVSARLTENECARLRVMPGVRAVEPVHVYRGDSLATSAPAAPALQKQPAAPSAAWTIDYGSAYDQVQMINVPLVHSLDITGRGVTVGMLDTGFRWREHEALKDLHVLAEYDFIQNDTVTANQAGDSADQDEHGTITMSALGGYMPGKLVGPAFGASFLLGKTEYVPEELNSEEDNWVAGLEWLERNGADIVSSSLGYSEFDPGQRSYTYADMNGHTATTTKAAAVAARKGVLVCVAMGNEAAHAWHFLTAPADADSIISVGAVTAAGVVAPFSSVGPTSDGRTKPDVCARGVQVVCATPSSTSQSAYTTNNGTSLATPLAAGAAALVLAARPELTPIEVRDALRSTASNSASPDNSIGWGIIDVYKAIMSKGLLVSAQLSASVASDSSRTVSVHIVSPSAPLVGDSLLCHYSTAASPSSFAVVRLAPRTISDPSTGSGLYTFALPKEASRFYLSARDAQGTARRLPSNAPVALYDARTITAPNVPEAPPESFALLQNYPNPFNGQTRIRYELPTPSHVAITVHDILGRRVALLVDGDQEAGIHFVTWNAQSAASGIYFYTIRTNGLTQTKKMVLVR